ncbi:DUF1016 N-terminal domain-containing protein, partial [Methanoculleus sp.]|uniref:DUF1016 N-terminal domain-containing protein n=1 Tax=Methanoculleus sp. TaxID=90427 RepID=UPI0025CD237F
MSTEASISLKEEEAAIVNGRNDSIQPTVTGELNTSIYRGIRNTLAEARSKAYSAVNSAMVEAYWEIGRQIDEAVGERAEYGKGLLRYLAGQLTSEFGKGFDESSLRRMRQFFKTFPIRATLWHELSWSHYRLLVNYPRLKPGACSGAPCGAQGCNLIGAKVDGSKDVLIRTGRLTRPLPIIRGTTESPATFRIVPGDTLLNLEPPLP